MKMFGSLFQRSNKPALNQKSDGLRRLVDVLSGLNKSEAGVDINENTALRIAAARACVGLIANDVAGLPLKVKRRNGNRMEDAADDPLFNLLLSKPNALHTGFEFKQMMTAQAALRGNAYAFINRSGNRVTEIWPLMAREVSVERVGYELQYTINAFEGQLSGTFGSGDVLHLRGLLWDGIGGLDPLFSAKDTLGLSAASERAQARSYKNGNRMPGYWSTSERLGPEQVEKLADQLMAATTGENQYRSPLLDMGMEYKTTGQTFEESQLIETRKQQILEVCAHFSVVPAVLGLDDKTQAFASVEAMMRWHLQHTLRPWLTAWEQALDRDLMDGASGPLFAKFDTSDMEKASTAERAQSYRDLVELGVMTRNEARALEGLPPLDGLDEPLTPLNMQGGQDGPQD